MGRNVESTKSKFWGKYCTPQLTKVTIHWKLPQNIPMNFHWESDNPLGNATEQVKIHWKILLQVHWNMPQRPATISEASISGVRSFAHKIVKHPERARPQHRNLQIYKKTGQRQTDDQLLKPWLHQPWTFAVQTVGSLNPGIISARHFRLGT